MYRQLRGNLGIALVAIVSFATLTSAQTSQPSSQTPTPATLALVETFTNGRIVWTVALERARKAWTPMFVRIEGWTRPDGVPETAAVQFSHRLEGRDIHVDVSVLNPGHTLETPVATVVVSPGASVPVEALRRFGIEPIVLSTARVLPMTPYLPTALSPTPEIEITSVDLLSVPSPGYRVVLRNLSSRAVSSVEVQTWMGDRQAMSTTPRGPRGEPLMQPGESYTLDIGLSSGGNLNNLVVPAEGVSPLPLDVIEINAVQWADGTSDGKTRFRGMANAIAADAGRALQFERVVAIFRDAMQQPGSWLDVLTMLRTRLTALADSEPAQLREAQLSMRAIKTAVLDDLERYESVAGLAHSLDDVREWVRFTLARYETQMRRHRHEPERPGAR